MNKRIFQSCLPGCLLLLSTCARSYACSTGSATITALNPGGTDTYAVTALSSAGQLTGFFYGNQPPHAFNYQAGTLNDLGTLGGVISEGFSINSSNQSVGVSYTTNNAELHGFLYSAGTMADLGTLGGGYSSASLINDAGQIAGVALLPSASDTTAFLYSHGAMTSLGTLGGTYSSPFALNNLGQVAGESAIASGDIHAFISSATGLLDLGTLGGNYSSAFWLNDGGVAVGESALVNSDIHAFLSAGGTMTDLGTFGGTYSSAFQINTNGQVIGIATIPNDAETHGFMYSNGVLTDLGTLGGTSVSPYAVNNRGQVVGVATLPDGTSHAFLWQQNQMVDLNSLVPANSGWQLSLAQFINDSGRIVGSGTLNGASAVFIVDLGNANNPPVAIAGPDQTVDCQAQATLNGSSSSDPDHDVLTFEWSSGGTVLGTSSVLTVSLPMGTNVVVLKVTDTCGASAQTNLTVVVADTTPPAGSCPASATVSADGNCQAIVPDFTSQVVATDNCSPAQSLVITQNPAAGTIVGLGQHPVTLTVTDRSGNSSTCTVLFTVADTTPPKILSVPSPFSITAGANCQAQVPSILGDVIASDSCTAAGELVKSQIPAAGTLIGVGDQSLLVTVTDASGNKATANVAFKVVDKTPPSFLSGPSPVKLSADGHCQAVVPNLLGSVLVSDNCTAAGQIGLMQSPLAGTVLPVGNYTITITATDGAGNSSNLKVSLEIDDTTAPVILSSPTQVTVSADANCQGQVPNVLSSVLATDNCTSGNQLTMLQSPAAGTSLPKGQSIIVVTVTDAAGNTTSTDVLLSIVDTTAPTIQSLAVSPSVLSPPNHQLVPVSVSALVTDNCDAAPLTRIVSITCNEVTAPGDIQITGNLTATLAATKSASGNTRVYTLNIQASDASGNLSTGVLTVSVPKSSGSSGNGNNKLTH